MQFVTYDDMTRMNHGLAALLNEANYYNIELIGKNQGLGYQNQLFYYTINTLQDQIEWLMTQVEPALSSMEKVVEKVAPVITVQQKNVVSKEVPQNVDEQILALRQKNELLAKKAASYALEKKRLQCKSEALEQENIAYKKQVDEFTEKLQKLEAQLKQGKAFEQENIVYKKQVTEFTGQIQKLEAQSKQREALRKENIAYKNQIGKFTEQTQKLEAQLKQREEQVKSLEANLKKTQDAVETVHAPIRTDNCQQLQTKIEELQALNRKLFLASVDKEQTITSLRTQINELSKAPQMADEVSKETLQNINQVLLTKVMKLKSDLQKVKLELMETEALLKSTVDEKQKLETTVQEMQDTCNCALDTKTELEAKMQKAQSQIMSLSTKLKNAESENKELVKKMNNAEASWNAALDRNTHLTNKIEKAQLERQDFIKKLEAAHSATDAAIASEKRWRKNGEAAILRVLNEKDALEARLTAQILALTEEREALKTTKK